MPHRVVGGDPTRQPIDPYQPYATALANKGPDARLVVDSGRRWRIATPRLNRRADSTQRRRLASC